MPATAVLADSIVDLVTVRHPPWMAVAGIILPIVAAPAAIAMVRRGWVVVRVS